MTETPKPRLWLRFLDRFFAPVDIASTVFFRVAFGLILVWEVYRYFAKGWIAGHFITPAFHFKYYGFGWVHPLPGDGMYYLWGAMGAAAGCVALGLLYRAAIISFTVMFAYMFFIEQSRYLNHFYLVLLIAFILCTAPAHRAFSLDALIRPSIRSQTMAAWHLWLLRFQIGVVYVFGAVHKTNPDWMHGQPMRTWLAREADTFPVIGRYFTDDRVVQLFVWGGLGLDALAVPLLLWRRTRIPVFVAIIGFHVFNSRFFSIGIFPWFMVCATLLFFSPDWPRTLAARFSRQTRTVDAPVDGVDLPLSLRQKGVLAFVSIFVVFQSLFPLRAYLYPGHILWTEQGMWFSWNMMLSLKFSEVVFEIRDPDTGQTWTTSPQEYLTPFQQLVSAHRPDMILQLAHHIAEDARRKGFPRVEVYALSMATLNGRKPQPYIDPRVNLARIPRDLAPETWVMPLQEPYPPKHAWAGEETPDLLPGPRADEPLEVESPGR